MIETGLENQMNDPMRARLKAAVGSVTAPPRLEAKIRSSVRQSQREGVWGRYLLPVAAVALLSVGLTVAYQLGHLRVTAKSQEAYIGSISTRVSNIMKVGLGDHVHCAYFRKFPKTPPTLAEMSAKLGPEYEGLLSLVKDRVPADLPIVMAHRCKFHGREFIHLAFRNDSRLLSMVISLKRDGESFTKETLAPVLADSGIPVYRAGVQRFEIAGFESRDHLVYLVSDLPGQKNADIMTAMAPAVTEFLNKPKA